MLHGISHYTTLFPEKRRCLTAQCHIARRLGKGTAAPVLSELATQQDIVNTASESVPAEPETEPENPVVCEDPPVRHIPVEEANKFFLKKVWSRGTSGSGVQLSHPVEAASTSVAPTQISHYLVSFVE